MSAISSFLLLNETMLYPEREKFEISEVCNMERKINMKTYEYE